MTVASKGGSHTITAHLGYTDPAHGEGCGHVAVLHIDYVHDGHLHSLHGEHYEEH